MSAFHAESRHKANLYTRSHEAAMPYVVISDRNMPRAYLGKDDHVPEVASNPGRWTGPDPSKAQIHQT